jgi:hypothetical protein
MKTITSEEIVISRSTIMRALASYQIRTNIGWFGFSSDPDANRFVKSCVTVESPLGYCPVGASLREHFLQTKPNAPYGDLFEILKRQLRRDDWHQGNVFELVRQDRYLQALSVLFCSIHNDSAAVFSPISCDERRFLQNFVEAHFPEEVSL